MAYMPRNKILIKSIKLNAKKDKVNHFLPYLFYFKFIPKYQITKSVYFS